MSCEALVHFTGHWSTAERETIREAITAYEDERRPTNGTSVREDERPGSTWIVVSTPLDATFYYFAHRKGTYDSISGGTASELAEKILSQIDVLTSGSSDRTPDARA